MQVLKEELRTRIVEAARDEFYLKGYEKASMRGIAGKAGITAGNLYRYFKNKDEIFEAIVSPVYNLLFYYIEHHNEEHEQGDVDKLTEETIFRLINEGSDRIAAVLKSYRKSFLILVDGSGGTKYAGVKELAVRTLAEHMEEHHTERKVVDKIEGFGSLARAVATSFIEGYLDIIRSNDDDEALTQTVKDYTYVMLTGLVKVLI